MSMSGICAMRERENLTSNIVVILRLYVACRLNKCPLPLVSRHATLALKSPRVALVLGHVYILIVTSSACRSELSRTNYYHYHVRKLPVMTICVFCS